MNTRISAIGIDQRKNWPPKFLGDLHDADGLAITFGMRRAEIAVDALLHVTPLLRADDQNFLAVKPRHPANKRGIVAKPAIAVNLAPIGKYSLDVIKSLRPLGMTRQFGLLPGGGGGG